VLGRGLAWNLVTASDAIQARQHHIPQTSFLLKYGLLVHIAMAGMTELAFARQFLTALDSRSIKLSSDHVADAREYPAQGAVRLISILFS
jgi:hypothetical protein